MKKGFLIANLTLVLLLMCGTYAFAESVSLVGYGFDDKLTISEAGTKITGEITSKGDFSYEFIAGGSGLEGGFGLQYQFQKKTTPEEDSEQLKFQYFPVYGIIALGFAETELTNTYLVAKVGYNFLKVAEPEAFSDKGGLYYAFGLSMKIGPVFRTQVLYEVCNGEIATPLETLDMINKVYSIRCGLAF